MIDGKRCSKCCEVLTISESKSFREWRAYARRYGRPDNFKGDWIYQMLRKISKRRAKKINPKLVSRVGSNQSYWLCKYHSGSGCDNYEGRPRMCSEYPYYGRTLEEWQKSEEMKRGALYTEGCTYYIEVK